jgi:DUF4097 and DUF4098 domain-containing protein YvlB
MMMLGPTLVMVAALAAPAPQDRGARPPLTDQTVAVAKGARLTVDSFAGDVIVKAWDRDSVRVQARHHPSAKVNVRTTPAGLSVQVAHQARGSVDLEITAPAWMPLRVVGTHNFITIEGSQSEVWAETTQGDVIIKGGTATVTAKSIMGEVIIEGARGKVTASSVNEGIQIIGASGDITAETTNGDISLTQVKSASLDVNTINGDIEFEGVPADRGHYRFTTHNGDITVAIPQSANVSFGVRIYQGRFSTALSLNGPPRSEVRNGRRTTYISGNGSAEMELETFGGSIRVVGPGGLKSRAPAKPKDKEKDDDRDQSDR